MKNIEDIYAASPMQQFMLLHSVSREQNDSLFNQFGFKYDGELNVGAFDKAWQAVVDAHTSLRTGFVWQGVPVPQQVVRRSVQFPLRLHDWRSSTEGQAVEQLSQLYAKDRAESFDLRKPPLMRIQLIRRSERGWYLLWSSHHLVMDRWCIPILLRQVSVAYEQACQNSDHAVNRTSFRPYIEWLSHQNADQSRAYWIDYLDNISPPPALPTSSQVQSPVEILIHTEQRKQLIEWTKTARTTAGSVLHGVWALVFNHLHSLQDVVLGTTTAGRPPEVANVEDTVGTFVTNLPLRIRLNAEQSLSSVFQAIQTDQMTQAEHNYLSPAELWACARLSSPSALYTMLLVWIADIEDQNDQNQSLKFESDQAQFGTTFPLTISMIDGANQIMLRLDTADTENAPDAQVLGDLFSMILAELLAAQVNDPIGSLPSFKLSNLRAEASHPAPAPLLEEKLSEAAVSRDAVTTELLREVVQTEWMQALRTGPSDLSNGALDFFEAGGTSLQAASMHAAIEIALRQKIPLLQMYATPTLDGIVKTIAKGEWPAQIGYATHLRETGSDARLFCIASPDVNTVGYALLARHMPATRPMTVLQAPPLDEALMPSLITDLAKSYLSALRRIQPQGPYHLFSMCAGSHISLEVARALRQQGEHVAFFGVVNTWSLYSINRLFHLNRGLNILRYYRGRIAGLIKSSTLPEEATPRTSSVKNSPTVDTQVGADSAWVREAGFSWKLPDEQAVNIDASIFRIRHQPFWRSGGKGLGWERRVKRVSVFSLPANDHDDILREPQVCALSEALEQRLSASLSKSGDTKTITGIGALP